MPDQKERRSKVRFYGAAPAVIGYTAWAEARSFPVPPEWRLEDLQMLRVSVNGLPAAFTYSSKKPRRIRLFAPPPEGAAVQIMEFAEIRDLAAAGPPPSGGGESKLLSPFSRRRMA